MSRRARVKRLFVSLTTISLLCIALPQASAGVTIANTILGSKVTTQDSNCGSLVLGNNSLIAGTGSTVDIIFSLATNANPAGTQGLVGGQSGAMNILINNNNAFKRIDLDFGAGTVPFYLQGNAGLVPGTTYHMAIQNNGTTSRIWINGAALTTSAGTTGVNLSSAQSRGPAKAITQIGNFYGNANGAFQGTIKYLRINSTLDYSMASDTVTMTNTLANTGHTDFLLTPSTVIPTYSLITAETYTAPNVVFTGTNNFSPGESITVKAATATAFNKTNAVVLAATSTSFTINYSNTSPGTWTGLGSAVTTAVTKDDIGNTPITWYDGVCSTANGSPGLIVVVVASIGLSGGGNQVIYRTSVTLQVSVPVAGKVTFFQQGKSISGCKNISYAIGTATCNWKPMQHGVTTLTAVLTPTDSSLVTSVPGNLQVFVVTRTSLR